jgi:hypothetical protein
MSEPLLLGESYEAPNCVLHGNARGARFAPEGFSLWRVAGELDAGSELEWGTNHGDEAIYLLDGSLDIGGIRVDPESAVIVEASVPSVVKALEKSRIVHFGPQSPLAPRDGLFGPAEDHGRGVHSISLGHAERVDFGDDAPWEGSFCDSTCRTCRITFFMMSQESTETSFSPSHSHSEDEIIHLLDGTLQVGPLRVEAGMSIAVPRDVRYGFRAPGPYRLLNYRRDVSNITTEPGSVPRLEVVSQWQELGRSQ